jgi:CBS domain-containing protein
VDVDTTVYDAARYMSERVIGAVPVTDRGRLVGMFTERDLMTRVVVPRRDPVVVRVREVMTREITVASPDDLRMEATAKMRRRHCRHLPVVENGRLVGVISQGDLLAEDAEERLAEVRMLTEYVQYVPPGY